MKTAFIKFFFVVFLNCVSLVVVASDLKLRFQIDEDFLICHTFAKVMRNSLSETVMKMRSELNKDFQKELEFLRGLDNLTPKIVQKEHSRLKELIKRAKSLPVYNLLLQETKNHLNEVESEWEINYISTYEFMSKLAKISFDKEIKVFITHPEVFQGRFLEDNTIAWGRKAEWTNYATVYLWHEVLHTYLHSNDRAHGLIELMTDDALRAFLNGGKYPPFTKEGHPKLVKIKTCIFFNYWQEYLNNPATNIFQLESELMNATLQF